MFRGSLRRWWWVVAAWATATSAARTGAAQVAGSVVDAATQLPVVGARVSVQASAFETVTDPSGAFSVPDGSGPIVVTAAKKGYFTTGQAVQAPANGVALELDLVPTADDPAWTFRAPQECINCHPSQYWDWHDSNMGKAGLNTWVYDTYDGTGTPGGDGGFVYTRDSMLAAANPASECRSCHQPEPWALDPYSALGPIDQPTEGMLHGIGCDVCHKMADYDESKTNYPGLWPGVVTLRKPQGFEVEFGALGDVDFASQPDLMRASYQPQITAAICAACHQDKNDPDLDGDFEEADGVVSEPTYQEWLASPYADPADPKYATCATCHMPPSGEKAACITLFDMNRPMGDVRRHTFEGTTPEFLENAVSMTLDAKVEGGALVVDVAVTNDATGHHVPTGVTIRNVILVVEAYREADGLPLVHTGTELVHDLGGVGDPADGYFAGLPGKLFAKVNHDADGNGPTFFTDATGITFDTRIPPLATDTTQYAFELPEGGGDVHVRARLVYRRSWRALVDAKAWVEDGHGQPLEDLAPPHFGHLMELAENVVPVPPSGCATDSDCEPDERCDAGSCVPRVDAGAGGSAGGGGGVTGGPAASADEAEDEGCDCRVVGTRNGTRPAIGLLALSALVCLRRRARRRM